ncbi:MAG: hypothetical protein ACE37M_09850 [Henriciella sp.]
MVGVCSRVTQRRHPALPTQVGTHGGWLTISTAMGPDLRQENGTS